MKLGLARIAIPVAGVFIATAAPACSVPIFVGAPQTMIDDHARALLLESKIIADGVVLEEAEQSPTREARPGTVKVTRVYKGDVRVGDSIPIATNMCAGGIPKGGRGMIRLNVGETVAWASFVDPLVALSIARQLRENPAAAQPEPWRRVATEADQAKIDKLIDIWLPAIRGGPRRGGRGLARAVDALGTLVFPDMGLPPESPPAGYYQCRTVTFAEINERPTSDPKIENPRFEACRVSTSSGGKLRIDWIDRAEGIGGHTFRSGGSRLILLGTRGSSRTDLSETYRAGRSGNVAGLFQQMASGRYRLVMPRPRPEVRLEIIEFSALGSRPWF